MLIPKVHKLAGWATLSTEVFDPLMKILRLLLFLPTVLSYSRGTPVRLTQNRERLEGEVWIIPIFNFTDVMKLADSVLQGVPTPIWL